MPKSTLMNTNKNDLLVILPLIFLLGFGLIMVSSSSIYIADDMKTDPFYFAERQFIFVAIGLITLLFFLVIPSELLYKADWIFLLVSILLLIALFIPEVGTSVKGSLRWIRIGPINISHLKYVNLV